MSAPMHIRESLARLLAPHLAAEVEHAERAAAAHLKATQAQHDAEVAGMAEANAKLFAELGEAKRQVRSWESHYRYAHLRNHILTQHIGRIEQAFCDTVGDRPHPTLAQIWQAAHRADRLAAIVGDCPQCNHAATMARLVGDRAPMPDVLDLLRRDED